MNHNDGFALQYGNPANSDAITGRIQLIYQHLMHMSQGSMINDTAPLPVVPCPASPDGVARKRLTR